MPAKDSHLIFGMFFTHRHCTFSEKATELTLICRVEPTDITDTSNPLIHLLLAVCYQIENSIYSVDIKNIAVFKLLLVERQSSIHLLAQIKVNDPDGLLGMVIFVVFQNIWIPC